MRVSMCEHQSSHKVYHMLLLGPSGHCLTPFSSSSCTNGTKQHYYTTNIWFKSVYILYLFWSCILVHILYSRLSYKCFGASMLSFGWLWLNGQFACRSSLFLVVPLCSLFLHFRFLLLDLLDSALNAWNLVDLVKSLQRRYSKYLHRNDLDRFVSRLLKRRWISLNVSAIKHY